MMPTPKQWMVFQKTMKLIENKRCCFNHRMDDMYLGILQDFAKDPSGFIACWNCGGLRKRTGPSSHYCLFCLKPKKTASQNLSKKTSKPLRKPKP